VTVQGPAPEQPPPDHSVNAFSLSGVAVRTTLATEKVASQAPGQSMPSGSDRILPLPDTPTVRRAVPTPSSEAAAVPPGLAATARAAPTCSPTVAGAKRTPTVQLAPGASSAGQSFDDRTKPSARSKASVPVAACPVFCTVSCASELSVAMGTAPKLSE